MSELELPANIRYMEPRDSSITLRDSLQELQVVETSKQRQRTVQLDNGSVVDAPWTCVSVRNEAYVDELIEEINEVLGRFVEIHHTGERQFEVHYTYRVGGEDVAPFASGK